MDRKTLKEQAKATLKGKVGECVKLLLVFFGINFLLGFGIGLVCVILNLDKNATDLLSSIIGFIFSGLFGFGMVSFYLKMSRNEEVTYKELFAKKDLMIPYIVISLIVGLLVALGSILFIIPGIVASISYSFVYFIFLDNPNMKPLDTLKASRKMLDGHKMDLFILMLSFLGWIILGIFTFGILYFWLIPYMMLTECNFYNKLKSQQ